MTARVRAAERADVPGLAGLIVEDARRRQAADPALWAVPDTAGENVAIALSRALGAEAAGPRQHWLLAEGADGPIGVAHAMPLPVPPIHAGRWGEPGLLLGTCALFAAAPPGAADALLAVAEADLRSAGARVMLAACEPGGRWQADLAPNGYGPLPGGVGLEATVLEREGYRPAIVWMIRRP